MNKKYCFFITLLSFCTWLNAQNNFDEQLEIAEAESKAAQSFLGVETSNNTGNYDVTYHRLEFEVDPAIAFIEGDVTTYFEAKENLNQVIFDLSQAMNVSKVMQDGTSLNFQHSNEELIIDLPQTQAQGVLDSLTISYSGVPVSSGFDSFEQSSHNGNEILWTLSEPYGAKDWWPCKQNLIDKIEELDVFITSPATNSNGQENIAVSNGLEIEQIVNGSNKTTHFHHSYPIPAYLVAIAVSNYSVYNHTVTNNGNPFPITNYVYPENLSAAQSATAVTVDIMDLFIENFGNYPYEDEKYGHAQFGWGGGMEHTTVSFMGGFSRGLIAHELGHQWFGDKVTCGSWQDIWVNEGFATYMASMVIEDFDGENAFNNHKEDMVSLITSQPGGSVYVPATDTLNVSRVFSSRLSYNKGAMVLHMLRKKLGDANFFQALQNYLNDPNLAFSYVTTEDLKNHLENESGENLDEFFSDWVYGEGYPSFTLTWEQYETTNDVEITLSQIQSHPSVDFFEVGVPIRLIGTDGEVLDMVLNHTSNNQQFTSFSNVFEVEEILIDPNFNIISSENTSMLDTIGVKLSKLKLYPNPTKGMVNIQKPKNVKISSVEIYNTLGAKTKSIQLSSSTFSVESLASGVYFVKLKTSEGNLVRKLIKE